MASGKSSRLIRAYKTAPFNFDVYSFGKSEISKRGAYKDVLTTTNIGSTDEIIPSKKYLILDECQFYQNWRLNKIITLCERYERVYLAGLDWIQPTGSNTFRVTEFYQEVCRELVRLPFCYSIYNLLARNDITGKIDARISKRYSDADNVIDKSNYFNINFNQAFIEKLSLMKPHGNE